MTNLEKEFTENGIHYALHGDYYFPDLELSEVPHQAIGRYGRMRLNYLREHRPDLYTRLILSGKLYEHLAEIDQIGRRRMEQIISQIADMISAMLLVWPISYAWAAWIVPML